MKIPQIVIKLLDRDKFEQAEKKLLELRGHKNYRDPAINYLLGFIYDSTKNPKHSIPEAKRYFSIAIGSDHPIEDAFVRLARLEANLKHAVRIAKRGLSHFPQSSDVYEVLLDRSEPSEKAAIFEEMKVKGIVTSYSQMVMAQSFFEEHRFTDVVELIPAIQTDDVEKTTILDLMLAFSNLELNDLSIARSHFSRLIEDDVNHDLEYNPYFGSILCELRDGNNDKALEYFAELPVVLELSPPLEPFRGPLWFDTVQYYLKGLSGIEKASTDKTIVAKARGIRGVLVYNNSKSANYKTILKDIRFASKIFPGSKNFYGALKGIAIENSNYVEAHKLTLQYMDKLSWNELERESEYLDFSYVELADEKAFTEILAHVTALLTEAESTRIIAKGCLEPIVDRLYTKKAYGTIAQLADLVDEHYLLETNVLFWIAYSYSELSKKDLAIKYYEHHAKKQRLTAAVANNLGILYENEGDFQRAEQYLQEAVALDSKDTVAKRNLRRVLDLRSAKTKFLQETFAVKDSVLALVKYKDVEGYIRVSRTELPAAFNGESRAASAQFKYLLEKLYVLRVEKEPVGNEKYKINPEIETQITALEKELECEKDLASIAGNISGDNLAQIGYNDILSLGLTKITSHDLQAVLQRDIKEAALSVLTKCHKTTLVLCGSIIEAVLLEKMGSRNIIVYQTQGGKNKAVGRMDLNDLLYVAYREHIVDEQLYHLGHALRGFRNLIHPSVEQRRKAMTVSESNARIAWEIMVKLIMEL